MKSISFLLTGGARSGKSSAAESILVESLNRRWRRPRDASIGHSPIYYIPFMSEGQDISDPESRSEHQDRILKHIHQRDKRFTGLGPINNVIPRLNRLTVPLDINEKPIRPMDKPPTTVVDRITFDVSMEKEILSLQGHMQETASVCGVAPHVIVECLSTYLGRLYSSVGDKPFTNEMAKAIETFAINDLTLAFRHLRRLSPTSVLIVVTNEVGMSTHEPTLMGRSFVDTLGRINQAMAKQSNNVLLFSCGRYVKLEPFSFNNLRF